MVSSLRILLCSILPLLLQGASPAHSDPPNGAMNDAEPIEVSIRSSEFEYQPKRVSVEAGQPVHVVLDNSRGTMEHDLSAPELGLYLKAAAGKSSETRLVFDRPGQYDFKCSLPGHHESGMAGVFDVSTGVPGTEPAAKPIPLYGLLLNCKPSITKLMFSTKRDCSHIFGLLVEVLRLRTLMKLFARFYHYHVDGFLRA